MEKTTKSTAKYTRDQWLTLVAAAVFLAGGVFMLINVFGGHTWSFIVGITLAVVASCIMGIAIWDARRTSGSQSTTEQSNAVEN